MSVTKTELENLRDKSLSARDFSYSPYSKFRVGAVLLTQSGEWIQGANVENASYGGAICAERVAITRAIVSIAAVLWEFAAPFLCNVRYRGSVLTAHVSKGVTTCS